MPEAKRAFRLIVRTPSGVVVDEPVTAVNAEDESGRFGLRPGVEPLVSALVPTVLEYRDLEGVAHILAVHRGSLRAERDEVRVAVRRAIPCSSLEAVRRELVTSAQQERVSTKDARRIFGTLYQRLYAALIAEERSR